MTGPARGPCGVCSVFFPNSILAGVFIEQKRSGERVFLTGAPTGGGAVVEERVHAGPLWFWPP